MGEGRGERVAVMDPEPGNVAADLALSAIGSDPTFMAGGEKAMGRVGIGQVSLHAPTSATMRAKPLRTEATGTCGFACVTSW